MVFILSTLWWIRIRDLWKLPDGRDWLWTLRLVLMGGAILSKFSVQFSVDGWGCVPSLLFGLRPNYGELMRTVTGNSFKRTCIQCSWCHSRPLSTHTSLETPGRSLASLAQSLVGTLLLSPGVHRVLFVCSVLLGLSFFLHFSHSDRRE